MVRAMEIIPAAFFVSVFANINLQLPETTLINKEIINYIVQTDLKHSTVFGNSTTFLITDDTPETEAMVKPIAEEIGYPIIVFRSGFSALSLEKIRPCLTYIFFKDKNDFDNILLELLSSNSFKVNIPVALIVCDHIKKEEEEEISFLLRRLWSYGLHRVIVIYISDRLHVKRFNPFFQEIYEVPPIKSTIFVNQMKNMNGYKLRIGLFEEWPILKKDVNWLTLKKKWIGRDITLLDNMMRLMNATYKVVEPSRRTRYKGALLDIQSNKTDLCFVRHFQTTTYEGVEFNEFNDIANLQILVPKPRKMTQSESLLGILHKRVWIAFIVSLCTLVVFMKLVVNWTKLPWGSTDIFLDLWGMFLGVAMYRFHNYPDILKISVVFWIWSSLILNVSFQSRLMNQMQFVDYHEGIRNLQDLEKAKIPIYSAYNVTHLTGNPSSFKGQLIKVNATDIKRVLWNERPNAAFVVSFGVIRGDVNPDLFPRNQSISHVMISEPLSFSFAVYSFRKNSPYTRPFGMRILELRQFGFASKVQQKVAGLVVEDEGLRRLSFHQVEAAFSILIGGISLCFVVFLGEFILQPQVWG